MDYPVGDQSHYASLAPDSASGAVVRVPSITTRGATCAVSGVNGVDTTGLAGVVAPHPVEADPAFEYYQLSVLHGTSCASAIHVFKALAIQVLGRNGDSQQCYAGYCNETSRPITAGGYRCTGDQVGDVSVTYDIVCRRGAQVVAAYSTEPGG